MTITRRGGRSSFASIFAGLVRAALGALPMAAILTVTVTATPVLADCRPVNAAFAPGPWAGRVSNVSTQSYDGLTVAVTDGFGAFDLVVDDHGAIEGSFRFKGEGYAEMLDELDEGSSAAQWFIEARAGGTSTLVTLDGEMEMAMEAIIDVHTSDDAPDPYSHDGQDLYAFGVKNTLEWRSELEPRTADCVSISGVMATPVGFEVDEVAWYAVRTDYTQGRIDKVEERLVDLLDQAERVIQMETFDPWIFTNFMYDLLRFDSLINVLEQCNPDDISTVGPAWDFLRSVTLNTMRIFLTAAEGGAYSTSDVVRAMTVFLQGGMLGWRGEECIGPTSDEFAHELFLRFEEILLARWQQAQEAGNASDAKTIAYAAIQFGFPRLLAATQGGL